MAAGYFMLGINQIVSDNIENKKETHFQSPNVDLNQTSTIVIKPKWKLGFDII